MYISPPVTTAPVPNQNTSFPLGKKPLQTALQDKSSMFTIPDTLDFGTCDQAPVVLVRSQWSVLSVIF